MFETRWNIDRRLAGCVGVLVLVAAMVAGPAWSQPLPSNASGCATGARCIRTTQQGKPSSQGRSVAQCRGDFADFIVPSDTIPAAYGGPWFQPELIENATGSGPSAARPWEAFDPFSITERMKFVLALRNYAFASKDLRAFTPNLTVDADYRDASAGGVNASLRAQKWYPAPRMIYGRPDQFGVREAAYGMTRERTVEAGELADNTSSFRNYAVAYYDERGARTYEKVWSTATAGEDVPDPKAMQIAEGGFVYKLLFSAAEASDFPTDILENSLQVDILPERGGSGVSVRLLQIDVAVKDSRAEATGWFFATYAYDRSVTHRSVWRRMVPVGLMWGNDPSGPPIDESWITPNAPAYARNHLGLDDRLNGPVDNPDSACMSCHSTAQAPAVANMLPTQGCRAPAFAEKWFRNLSGSTPFGRFTPRPNGCDTTPPANAPEAADYSLQLSQTVSRAQSAPRKYNPCTWNSSSLPPTPAPPAPAPLSPSSAAAPDAAKVAPVFDVVRDP